MDKESREQMKEDIRENTDFYNALAVETDKEFAEELYQDFGDDFDMTKEEFIQAVSADIEAMPPEEVLEKSSSAEEL